MKPAKAALDESCPYTFNYVKVRENPNNKRRKVTGFRFYPVYQPQFRDEELEGKELQAKVTSDDQYKLYEKGSYNDVNVIIGTNSDEGSMSVSYTHLYKTGEQAKVEVSFYKYGIPRDGEVNYEIGDDMLKADTKDRKSVV